MYQENEAPDDITVRDLVAFGRTIYPNVKKEDKEDEVFETVRTIVSDHLEEIAKITYDLQADHKVKVEVTQNM